MIRLSNWEKLSLRIIVLFAVAMLTTFAPDYLHAFFGDTFCTIVPCSDGLGGGGYSGPHCHFGYRHWLWILMCICLFITQMCRIFNFIDNNKFN